MYADPAWAKNQYKLDKKNKDENISKIEGKSIGHDPFGFKTAEEMYKAGPVRPFDKSAEDNIKKIQDMLTENFQYIENDNFLTLLQNLNMYRKTPEVQKIVEKWAQLFSEHIKKTQKMNPAKKSIFNIGGSSRNKGDDFYIKGNFEKASEKYRTTLTKDPMNLDARNNFALCQLHLSNDLIAQFEFEILRLIKSDYLPASINLAVVLERASQSERAKKLTLWANNKMDNIAIAAFNAAWFHSIDEDYEKALKLLKPLSELDIKQKYNDFYKINEQLLKSKRTKQEKAEKIIKKSNPEKAATKTLEKASNDNSNASKLNHQAADKGDALSMHNLGIKYEYGEGVKQDYAKAVQYYQKAAENGHGPAMYNLGVMFAAGKGVEKNYIKAIEWYKKAADKGDADAMNNLGVMYEKGYGVNASSGGAIKWYQMAADKGSYNAMNNLGLVYENKKEYITAINWYQKAAEKDHAGAIGNLGYMYENGRGVKKDLKKAKSLYLKAAKLGSEFAKKSLQRLE